MPFCVQVAIKCNFFKKEFLANFLKYNLMQFNAIYKYKKVGIFHVEFSRDWLSRFG